MSPAPRVSLPDDFVHGRSCAVCGADGLRVMHAPGVPDFVHCTACRSAFVADTDSPLVMYGSIPEAYPHARAQALRRWATLDAVEAAAEDDRPRPAPPAASRLVVPLAPDADLSPSEIPLSAGVPIPEEPELPSRFAEPVALSGEAPPPAPKRAWYEPEEAAEEEQEEAESWPLPSVDSSPSAEDTLRSLLRGGPMDDLYQLSPLAMEDEPAEEAEAESDDTGLEGVPPLMAARLAQAAAKPDTAPPSRPRPSAPPPSAAPEPPAWSRPVFATPEPAPAPATPGAPDALNEPPPGVRYRTVLRGERVIFPHESCAHCGATPARQRLSVIASLPDGQAVGMRKRVAYHLPLCRSCYRRAAARSEEESSARMQAHLVSALFALVLLVIALGVRVINLSAGAAVAGFLILIVLILGYTLPALILLGRMSRYPPPPDSAFVRSTLFVPEEAQGSESAFEWRNGDYARAFADANRESLIGSVARIKDRTLTG
jgi:hypothetical protein